MPLPPLLLTAIMAMPDDLTQYTTDLKAADPAVRIAAAERLMRLGPEAQAAAVALAQAACDQDEGVREAVIAAVEELGPPSSADAPALAKLLGNPSSDVGYWAATLLGRLAIEAADTVTGLATAVTTAADPVVRQRAAWALGQVGPAAAPALDVLRQAADSDDPRLQRLAARAIAQIES